MARASRRSGRDWKADPFLQSVGAAALASAMRADDLGMLSATVQDLRSRGTDVETPYRAVHPRFPGAPALDELEQRAGVRTSP
ncbi:MAG: hypothetical protein H0V51_06770 [Chloroflexi bacterium]|nr:hypothetical protein [Chloroflexota bacterium]